MDITINGKTRTLEGETTLQGLLELLGIAPDKLAIELNGEFITADRDWAQVALDSGDRLEIVRFVGGG